MHNFTKQRYAQKLSGSLLVRKLWRAFTWVQSCPFPELEVMLHNLHKKDHLKKWTKIQKLS